MATTFSQTSQFSCSNRPWADCQYLLHPIIALPQIFKMLYGSLQGLVQTHDRLVPQEFLRPLAAVVVVGPSEGDLHGSKRDVDVDKRTEECTDELQKDGYEVDEPIRKVVLGSVVAKAHQDARQDWPKRHRFIVGYEKSLERKKKHSLTGCYITFLGHLPSRASDFSKRENLLARKKISLARK